MSEDDDYEFSRGRAIYQKSGRLEERQLLALLQPLELRAAEQAFELARAFAANSKFFTPAELDHYTTTFYLTATDHVRLDC